MTAISHSGLREPDRGGQRMISPRSTDSDHRLREMIERRIFGEEPVEHRAEQEHAAALEGTSRRT